MSTAARLLLLGRYRFYRQLAADFYQARYEDLAPILTGDARLGRIREHVGGLEARWIFPGEPGEPGAVTAILGYELSILVRRSCARGRSVAPCVATVTARLRGAG